MFVYLAEPELTLHHPRHSVATSSHHTRENRLLCDAVTKVKRPYSEGESDQSHRNHLIIPVSFHAISLFNLSGINLPPNLISGLTVFALNVQMSRSSFAFMDTNAKLMRTKCEHSANKV